MIKITGSASSTGPYIAAGLLAATGGVLATPLAAGPAVLLALIATILMLVKGRATLQCFGKSTLTTRDLLVIAFGGWFLAELLSTAINNQLWTNLDYPFRFTLGIGVFWAVRYSALRNTQIFYYAIAASGLVAAGVSVFQHFFLGMDRSYGWTNHPIYFGNLSILLGLYATIIYALMRKRLTAQLRIALVVAMALFLYAAILSGSRSSWLGLAGLAVLVDWKRVSYARLAGFTLATLLIMTTLLALFPVIASELRLTDAVQDIRGILSGDYRSSLGDRLQMWKAALLMFWSSPLIGTGSGFFQANMIDLVATGAVDLELNQGNIVYNQAHSEVMDVLATKGLVGLLAYLAILFLPFRMFQKLSRTSVLEAKALAKAGQATVVAFLMFGLTLATFKVQIYCAVYPAAIAVLAALALNLSDSAGTSTEKPLFQDSAGT